MRSPLTAALIFTACASAGPHAEPVEALPFIQNDYPRALAEAKARHVPLFVDGWAPW